MSFATPQVSTTGILPPVEVGSAGTIRHEQASRRLRTAVRSLAADALVVIAWGSVALAVALQLAGTQPSDWSTVQGILTQLGILTGLVGTDLMLLSLLLAARIPFVDRAIGHDRALSRHSDLGVWVVILIAAHGVLVTLGMALGDGVGFVTELTALLGTQDLVWAVVALGLLVLVGVSSAVLSIRRRLPHELWHLVHLTTYLAVIASIPHQFSMSTILDSTAARSYWLGLYLLTAFALITFRFLTPLLASLEHRLVVSEVVWVTPDTAAITMTGRHLERLHVQAGQFFHWRFLAPGLWWHQHPFSLSAAPDGRSLRITVRALGKGTRALVDGVRVGDKVMFEGPYGLFSHATRTSDQLVLVGAGAGIGPIVSMLEADEQASRVLVVLRASGPEDLAHLDEVRAACQRRGAELVTLVGHRDARGGWAPEPHGDLSLWQLAPWLGKADLYICGPTGWARTVIADATAKGMPTDQIHHENFSW